MHETTAQDIWNQQGKNADTNTHTQKDKAQHAPARVARFVGWRVCSPPVDLREPEGERREEDMRNGEQDEKVRERKCGIHKLEKVEVA